MSSHHIVLRGATVVNPDAVFVADVGVTNGVISGVGQGLDGDIVLDVTGLHVSSGFVDLHTHLREPGKEEAETIESGSRAAALGGYTAVVAMPNTDPAQDNVATVKFVREQGERAGLCDVYPSGCITVGRMGEIVAPFAELSRAGVVLFTDDGTGVQSDQVMRDALVEARRLNIVLAQHCEKSNLTAGAAMHDGECCSKLGVPGWPAAAEVEMVKRDLDLVRETGATMHFLHLSVAESVDLIRAAKDEGLPITAEVTPHHISLEDNLLVGFNPIFKVNPPLRTQADIKALHQGLQDGTIDAVATDHAPHAGHTKEQPLDQAPPGMLGLETALAVLNTAVSLDVQKIAELMSWNPARIARVHHMHGRPIAEGEPANIAVWDTTTVWTISREALASKSKNTPYHGMDVRGRVHHTILNGELVVQNGKAQK
ncbi:MAG: dihydroorotase [Ilumatobacteraceae bacterium]